MRNVLLWIGGGFFLIPSVLIFSQSVRGELESNTDALESQQEFRRGVVSFHNKLYEDALLSFERALDHDVTNAMASFWLGLAYYYMGFEQEALLEWNSLRRHNFVHEGLDYWIDAVSIKRGFLRPSLEESPLERMFAFSGGGQGNEVLLRPASFTLDDEGGYYIASFGSNLLLHLSASGRILGRFNGGIDSFQGPFDVFVHKDKLYVSEYGTSRIAVLDRQSGRRLLSIAKQGAVPGALLSPQYMAFDGYRYFYVSEWGNQRISKFDIEGNFILTFGRPNSFYSGLQDPVGLVYRDSLIYVADQKKKTLDVFDENGNFIKNFPLGLEGLEGLSAGQRKEVFIVTTRRAVYSYDIETQNVTLLSNLDGEARRFLQARYGANGNLLVSDFDASMLYGLASARSVYEGLFIRLDRLIQDAQRGVYVELSVHDRYGKPILGLSKDNFQVFENSTLIPPENFSFVYRDTLSQIANVGFVFDRQGSTKVYQSAMQEAFVSMVTQLQQDYSSLRFQLVSAFENPVLETFSSRDPLVLKTLLDKGTWSDESRFDLALIRAGGRLIRQPHRRALFYFGSGQLSDTAFKNYSLEQLIAYLNNNNIAFYPLVFSDQVRYELGFIAEETGGKLFHFSNVRGVTPLIEHYAKQARGTYLLHYSNFQRDPRSVRYANVAVEIILNQRSGRATLGFFPPVQ